MIALLILFLLVVVFLAFFIGMNLSNLCTLWIFKTYTEVPVAILVLIAFGAGIVFSLLLMLISKLRASMTTSAVESEVKKRVKSEKREKTEMKINKFKKNKKNKTDSSEELSDTPVNADN